MAQVSGPIQCFSKYLLIITHVSGVGGKLKFRKVAREEFQGERCDWEVSKSLRGEPAKGKLAHVSGPDQCISK